MAEKLVNKTGLEEFSKKIKEKAVFIKNEATSSPAILDLIYPVGSIYMSVNNVSPATFIGGTWVSFGQGRTLVGVDTSQTEFNAVQKTGGEKTHTLTVNEMPKHNHRFDHQDYSQMYSGGTRVWSSANTNSATALYTTQTGGDGAHNNLQPYITVYMWRRTA